MRELRRASLFARRLMPGTPTCLLGLALLLGLSSVAESQTPRVMTLSEAVADQRVDPILGLLMHRAAAATNQGDQTSLGAYALGESHLGELANFGRADIGPATPVALLIEGEPSRSSLESIGVVVGTVAGDVITATAPLSIVPAILAVPRVRAVRASGVMKQALNISVPTTEAEILWGGTPPSYPATSVNGKDVVVGIVDGAFDPRPSDFKNINGTTRFKSVWFQGGAGIPPAGFGYGVEYTPAQIDANQIDPLRDTGGHGTHVLGVAAGNGQSGNPAWQYVGVAPQADIIGVQSNLVESSVIDAVAYIFTRAGSKPAVVNLSLSINSGAHDGTHALDRALSQLTGPGRIITAPTGNSGIENGHARLNLAAGTSGDATFTIPTYTPAVATTQYISIEGWHDATAAFDIRLISPTGLQSALVTPGQTTGFVETPDGTIYIQNGVITSPPGGTGAKRIAVMVSYSGNGTPHPKVGTWTIKATRRSGTTSGIAHWWIVDHLLGTPELPAFTGSCLDTTTTIMSPATGNEIISTGAYTTKTSWINIGGSSSRYPNYPPLGRLASFSSRGPRRDGVVLPDVVAPGYGVMSTLPTTAGSISTSYKDPDGAHFMMKGTSVANAHTTGGVALLLQQNKTSTPSMIRTQLRTLANTDGNTGVKPNSMYGYGKLALSALGGTTDVGDLVAPGLAFRALFPNPSSEAATFEFDVRSLPGESGQSIPVGVRIIDVRGREVAHIAGSSSLGIQRLTWNGRMSSGTKAPSGIYFARLEVGGTKLQRKFVRVD